MRSLLAVLLIVALASAELAPLLNANAPRVVPGSYIVVLKDGLTSKDRDVHVRELQNLIEAAGDATSAVVFKYNIGSLIGFSASLTDIMLKIELAHPDVKYVEADQVYSIDYKEEKGERSPLAVITQTGATWGLVRTSQQALDLTQPYIYSSQAGAGVEVYVIDTGILTTHQDFGTRASWAFSAFPSEPDTDLNGHGTHCAGTIGGAEYGIAKEVSLFAVKVLNAGGGGTTATVIAGVDYVTNNHKAPAVGSMSLGGGASPTLDEAVEKSIAAGVVYSIAAGNFDADACNYSPARVSTAATVGATTNTDQRSDFSNWGTCVDIFAPGSFITSDWIGSDTATNTISGTSMATPHVAGVLALHLSVVGPLTPADNIKWLLEVATLNKITDPGTGSPNALLFSPAA